MIQALLMAFLLGAPQQAAGTYKNSGTVVREDKLDAASAANQNQIRIQGPTTLIVTIGAEGKFEFPNVRPGSYQVVVGPRITMPPVTLVVSDKDVTDFRVVIPLSNDLTGNVIVEGNGPRPRFTVSFNRVDATANPITAIATNGFTVTAPQGQYRITTTGLAAGYNIKSIKFGDVDALTQPIALNAAPGQVLTITLGVSSPPPWVQVSGRVTGGSATSVSLNGPAMADTLNVTVGPNGSFEFPMVLPGTYTARIIPASPLVPTTPITVGSTNVTNVEIRIPATKEVAGKITLRGSVPMPRLTFSLAPPGAATATPAPAALSILNGQIITTAGGGVNVPANPGADGLFKVTLPDGERRITIVPASIPAGYVVESFTYGATDLLKNPVLIALNDSSAFAITIDATQVRPRNISGKVTGLLTTQGVRVVLQGGNLGTGVESPITPDGSFAFSDILPGNYTARLSISGQQFSTSVRVDNQDVTNLTITYPRRFHIAAQVLVDGETGNPPNISSVVVEARGSTGAVATSSRSSENPSTSVLTVADGEHKVSVRNVPAGYVVKSIRYGTLDLQEQPLTVDGPITWEIVVRLVRTAR